MDNNESSAKSREPDPNTQIRLLEVANPLRESTLRAAIRALHLPEGSRGLDAGCGIGHPALLLAEAIGPNGHVTGLDIAPEHLLYAEKVVKKAGMSGQISFQEGNVNHLPFDDDAFDWVWSTDCVGYPAVADPVPLLKELARVVRPGGSVAILAWSSQQLLPGYPLLEARLNAASSAIIPYVRGKKPESLFPRALGWFREAGLVESAAQTFAGDVCAPLNDDMRSALIAFFQMLWGEPQPEESPKDRAEYQRLCELTSPDFILNLPDYYAYFTYTMFRGKVA